MTTQGKLAIFSEQSDYSKIKRLILFNSRNNKVLLKMKKVPADYIEKKITGDKLLAIYQNSFYYYNLSLRKVIAENYIKTKKQNENVKYSDFLNLRNITHDPSSKIIYVAYERSRSRNDTLLCTTYIQKFSFNQEACTILRFDSTKWS